MGSINIMGNNDTLNITRGKDKIKCVTHHDPGSRNRVYIAPLTFDKDDKPAEMGTSKRSFCTECSAMLWNYHDEYPQVSRPTYLKAELT